MSPDLNELIKVVGAPSVLLIVLGFGWLRYAQHQNKQIFDLFSNHVHSMGDSLQASIAQISTEFKATTQEQREVIQRNTEELRTLSEKIGEMTIELRHLNGRAKS